MKIYAVGTELFHAEEQRERYDETNGRFSEFCKSAWKGTSILSQNSFHLFCFLYRPIYSAIPNILHIITPIVKI
jgi:hypothetical protein